MARRRSSAPFPINIEALQLFTVHEQESSDLQGGDELPIEKYMHSNAIIPRGKSRE